MLMLGALLHTWRNNCFPDLVKVSLTQQMYMRFYCVQREMIVSLTQANGKLPLANVVENDLKLRLYIPLDNRSQCDCNDKCTNTLKTFAAFIIFVFHRFDMIFSSG